MVGFSSWEQVVRKTSARVRPGTRRASAESSYASMQAVPEAER